MDVPKLSLAAKFKFLLDLVSTILQLKRSVTTFCLDYELSLTLSWVWFLYMYFSFLIKCYYIHLHELPNPSLTFHVLYNNTLSENYNVNKSKSTQRQTQLIFKSESIYNNTEFKKYLTISSFAMCNFDFCYVEICNGLIKHSTNFDV